MGAWRVGVCHRYIGASRVLSKSYGEGVACSELVSGAQSR